MYQPKAGDAVRISGRTYIIRAIFSADYFGNPRHPGPDDGWMIEFKDTDGRYHYWKQYLDGGEFIPREI